MTINGVSTCTAGEKYEKFQLKIGRKVRTMYQYDYRDTTTGELFSCVKPTLDECRGYETLIVTFSDPIKVLDNMFADADAWGTDSLKGWVEDYESTRFTQINGHTAVITSEYNMPCVKEWLTRCTAIADIKEF